MGETIYPTLDEIVFIHDTIVERMGSPHSPLIHRDKLESALARPRNAAWYEGADLVRQAVILAVAISQSQAFLDGNKRAAFAALRVFLKVNGLAYQGNTLAIAHWLEVVADPEANRDVMVDEFDDWLRSQVVPSPQ